MALESTVLEGIKLYGPDGKSLREYQRVIVSPEAVRGEDGNYLRQNPDQWTLHHQQRGEEFPSVPLYMAIMEKAFEIDPQHPLLHSIVRNMNYSWLSTSTKVDYANNFITHGYGGRSPLEVSCTFPEGSHYVREIQKDESWRKACQSLLLTQDIDKTMEMLQSVSGVLPYIWTPEAGGRRGTPERAAFLNVSTVRTVRKLNLNCDCSSYSSYDSSRSVVVE